MRKLKNEELNRPDLDQFKESEKTPIVLVLDNVRSMHNVGSAFRTADAFAIESIALCGITAQPPHREIHKTALGATESVEWKHYKNTMEACKSLRDEGYTLMAIEQVDDSISLESFKPSVDQKLAVIFGNEVFGVEEEVVAFADNSIEIPQFGTKHSLNISVSIGVVLWDLVSKMRFG
ncbi:RNA methyltransferase [Roseivirga sp. 4D4]|uniref:TrmH family RNA methyltransferase n=1 Tax=Roseivirga sp. 4D4 TaxID=1889784 RepID=UPI00085296AA|nr:TrmH family RNA methyltransferase [Roseivirga sp. 4D4]OEK02878.1 RNA methyltransferase [Roseivirga sp. 4D4]